MYERITEIVTKCEDKSATICEVCGKSGDMRAKKGYNGGEWYQTLCDECSLTRGYIPQ